MLSFGNNSGIEHLVLPHAEIVYSAGLQNGNVDLRRQFGDPAEALANREQLLNDTLKPSAYVLQVVQMEDDIVDLSEIADENLAPQYTCDGLIIDRPGVALGLNTADCFGLTMHDQKSGNALALIHAGRQGTQAGIHLKALYKLIDEHGIPGEDLRIDFSPGVHASSYAFSPQVPAEMQEDEGWLPYIQERTEGTFHIDVMRRLYDELICEKIRPHQIVTTYARDTGSDRAYFSHTRAHKTGEPLGRNAIAAILTN